MLTPTEIWACAEQINDAAPISFTERRETPVCLAIARPVHCVASPGGSAQVSVTIRRTV